MCVIIFRDCFNPRSRKGNDLFCLLPLSLVRVSIHVPARGTTLIRSQENIHWLCFNPRSRKGNDIRSPVAGSDRIRFQSTFPQGERRQIFNEIEDQIGVSIHVPARGTTSTSMFSVSTSIEVSIHVPARGTTLGQHAAYNSWFSFNPRSRKGNDNSAVNLSQHGWMFQSTFPQGERRSSNGSGTAGRCFNPRSRKGNDVNFVELTPDIIVSIHVPARGTTPRS